MPHERASRGPRTKGAVAGPQHASSGSHEVWLMQMASKKPKGETKQNRERSLATYKQDANGDEHSGLGLGQVHQQTHINDHRGGGQTRESGGGHRHPAWDRGRQRDAAIGLCSSRCLLAHGPLPKGRVRLEDSGCSKQRTQQAQSS